MSNCEHTEKDIPKKAAIFDKNVKIIHNIYSKLSTHIRTGDKEITFDNFHIITQITMRELNKHSLYGFEKKELCVGLLVLLLDSFGLPHIINYYTVEAMSDIIETIYVNRMHKFKKPKKCVIV